MESKHRLLIVDDETNIRMTLTHCFDPQRYDVDVAVNGEEALQKVLETNYDLVLLDIKMPGLNGMQVLQRIRQQGNNVNVVMMTAYGTVERAVEAMKLGAIDFISKPFTPEEIRSIVTDVLSREDLREDELTGYKDAVEFAKKCILQQDYSKAEEYLKKAVAMRVDAAEPHNLLGVLAEYRGRIQLAQTHYRAALALDPTYEPARTNLERTVNWLYSREGIVLGDEDNDKKRHK